MERVIDLLEKQDYRQALIRLWVLGSRVGALVEWRRNRKTPQELQNSASQFKMQLEREETPSLADVQAAPLALIAALDEYVHELNAPYNRASRIGRPELARTEEGVGYWLVPACLQTQWKSESGEPLDRLNTWFKRHVVLPVVAGNLDVVLKNSESSLDDALSRLPTQTNPELKVWIAHFCDAADVRWEQNPSGDWRTTQVTPHEARLDSIKKSMQAAVEHGAQVVVFPEFTLDLMQRSVLAAQLRQGLWPSVLLVVAGSFHEEVDGNFYNTAPCFDMDGNTVWTHRKLSLFGAMSFGAEDVSVGNCLQLLLTPIGRMTVLICKDFMDDDPPLVSLLGVVPVDWAWVPSFGDDKTIRGHLQRARTLARKSNTHTVVAQTLNTAVPTTPAQCVRGFGHGAGQTAPQPQVGEQGGLAVFELKFYPAPALPSRPNLKRIK